MRSISPREPIPADVKGLGWYPNPHHPRVFWVGVQAGDTLATLVQDIEAALASLGMAKEARPFNAHLTLARIKEPAPAAGAAGCDRATGVGGLRVVAGGSILLVSQPAGLGWFHLHQAVGVSSSAPRQSAMMPWLSVVIAYLVGGIPFGYLLVRWKTGEDVREKGSGNIGATNVLRTTGRAAAVATLVLDIAKGVFAVWLADKLSDGSPVWMSLAALAVMAGHAYPVFLKFQGGKAVASFIGAFLYLTPIPMIAALVVFVDRGGGDAANFNGIHCGGGRSSAGGVADRASTGGECRGCAGGGGVRYREAWGEHRADSIGDRKRF